MRGELNCGLSSDESPETAQGFVTVQVESSVSFCEKYQHSKYKMSRILRNFIVRRFASRLTYNEYGPPSEVVQLEQFDDPTPPLTGSTVVVKMLAAPVHPADVNTIQGTYPIKPSLPAIGGGEGVGEVLSIGPQVQNLKIGDWVFPGGNMSGTWTTRFVDEESNFVKVRQDISVLSAATLRTNPGTAYRMLKDFVDLQEGDIVIQNGANSAVGRAVIEIAKALKLKTGVFCVHVNSYIL